MTKTKNNLKWRKVAGKDEWRATHKLGRFIIYKVQDGAHKATFSPESGPGYNWDVIYFEDYADYPDLADLNFAKSRCRAFIDCKMVADIHKYYFLQSKLSKMESDWLNDYQELMDKQHNVYLKSNGYLTESQEEKMAAAEIRLEDRYRVKNEPLEQESHELWADLDERHDVFLNENLSMIQGMAAKEKMAALLDEVDATMADPIKYLEKRRIQLVEELIEIDKQLVEATV